MKKLTKEEALNEALAGMVGTAKLENVFNSKIIPQGVNAGKYGCTLGKKRISPVQIKNLQDEVKMLEQSQLWKIFTDTLKHEAEIRMFYEAKNEQDLFWGKAILHAIRVFESINTAIRNAETELSTPTPSG